MCDPTANFYGFAAKNIDGQQVSMEKYRGFVVVVVNVACKCGLTAGNYPELQQLYEKYRERGLRIAAFPSNQFGSQEPWPEADIQKFVTDNYQVTFDLYSKVNVNGGDSLPLFNFLKQKQGGTLGNFLKWNFTKFLIDRDGNPVKRYSPTDSPKSMEKDIIKLLDCSHL